MLWGSQQASLSWTIIQLQLLLKKGLPASSPSSELSASPSETSAMFCLLCSLVKHSTLKHTQEKLKQSCCCSCGGGFLRARKTRASKRESCTFTRRLPDNTWWSRWEMLKNVGEAVNLQVALTSGEGKGRIWRWGGICALLPYCKRKDRKECWRFSDKGNIISAGDVAAESRNLQFQKQSTQGSCGAGQWWGVRSSLLGLRRMWRWQVKVLSAPVLWQRSVSSTAEGRMCLWPACYILSPQQGQWAARLWAAMSEHQLASASSYLFITSTKHCCNANNNNEKEGIADITKLIKKLIFVLFLNKDADLDTTEAIHLIGYWLSWVIISTLVPPSSAGLALVN